MERISSLTGEKCCFSKYITLTTSMRACLSIIKAMRTALEKYGTFFQTEAYVVLHCATENNQGPCKNKRIYITSDTQAILRALVNPNIQLRLYWECICEIKAQQFGN